jgi:hypothetical protein
MTRQTYAVVTVTIEDRDDNGLRVWSDDLPGLILSGNDRQKICASIIPAIRALFEHKGLQDVAVHSARPVHEILKQPSPRNMALHVQHEQFVIEVAQAA